jgi:hypothetical protein
VKVDGAGVLLVDANRVLAIGATLTIYDHAGSVVNQRALFQAPYAYQVTVNDAAWLPGGGFITTGAIGAHVTLEPGTPNQKPLAPQGDADAFVARYAADGAFEAITMFPETAGNRREAVGILPQTDGSSFYVSRTSNSSNKLVSYLERLDASDKSLWKRTFETGSAIWSSGGGEGVVYVGGIVNGAAE